jgi:hypothetical protein
VVAASSHWRSESFLYKTTCVGGAKDNSIQLETLQNLNNDWRVTFKFADNITETLIFPTLIDWTTHADDRVKYYSGAAIYKNEFSYKKNNDQKIQNRRIYLELDSVNEMALVRINGQKICTLWSRPFRADITDAIRNGKNTVELETVNHWANRIIGDANLPESKRKTKTNIKRLNQKSPLLKSGLTGNIKIKQEM